MMLNSLKILILNYSYEPLQFCSAKRGLVMVLSGRAEQIECDGYVVRSPSMSLQVPTVIRVLNMVKRKARKSVSFSKKNILRRVNESGDALENIVTSVVKVGDIVAEIATASQEQAEGIDQVNKTVSNLDDLTQQNAALAEETSAASVSMNQRAREMVSLVDFFKLDNQAPVMKVVDTPAPPPQKKEKPKAVAEPPKMAVINQSSEFEDGEWEEF